MRNKADETELSPVIKTIVDSIANFLNPDAIYLYNQRINSNSHVTSFKLCIVADVKDKLAAESDIYMKFDCDVPYDILIYTVDEWEDLTEHDTSFAYKIMQTGTSVI